MSVALLPGLGAVVGARMDWGWSPLHLFAFRGFGSFRGQIVNHAEFRAAAILTEDALPGRDTGRAARCRQQSKRQLAADRGSLACVELLLAARAAPLETKADGLCALMVAAKTDQARFLRPLKSLSRTE